MSAKVKNLFMFDYIIDIFEIKRSSELVENFFYDLLKIYKVPRPGVNIAGCFMG